MIKFEKVSYEQFKKDIPEGMNFSEEELQEIYTNIKLPRRATKGSAAYDFYAPYILNFENGKSLVVPTGIRALMDNSGSVLLLAPRSGFGFKERMALDNTIGVIDSDYSHATNEGHIMAKIHYDNPKTVALGINQGKAFIQGFFVQFLTTDDDDATGERTGGFGSTSK